eukprot:9500784-Pyramimonas_sp.AAC.1
MSLPITITTAALASASSTMRPTPTTSRPTPWISRRCSAIPIRLHQSGAAPSIPRPLTLSESLTESPWRRA